MAENFESRIPKIPTKPKQQLPREVLKQKCRESRSSRAVTGLLDNIPIANIGSSIAKGIMEANEIDNLGCEDIPFDEIKEMLDDGFNKIEKLQDFSGEIAKNYWAIDRNHDLLLGNRGILLANQGLLLANTGLLLGVAFMMMVINSKINRIYDAVLRIEAQVEKNYEAILRIESKVDRNLVVMLSGFSMMERGFKEVIDFVRQTKIEGVTSELITFIRHFLKEKDSIRSLTTDQYIIKLEEVDGILHSLRNSRKPQAGSLHTLLYNIINQRFAIPENSSDRVALTALGLLCAGTETYISVMSFLLEEYRYLANFYYKENDLEKYNHYFSLTSTTYNDFKSTLAGSDGLIEDVINTLKEVKAYDFIGDEREDVVEFASGKITDLTEAEFKLVAANRLPQEKPTEKIKYNFFNSQVNTPIGHWEDRRKVSYALQFQSNDTLYQVGEWATPARVYKKANPVLNIGTDPKGRVRLIFRKFDEDKPEMVGIVYDSDQKEFRDIDRDLYNAVLEPNEYMALEEIEVILANEADIHSRFERGRQAIHAAAENGNANILKVLLNKGSDVNSKDTNGYTPLHIAAEVGHEDFIEYLVSSGANVNAESNLKKTALHVAAEKGYVNTVANLMKIEGVDINARDQRRFTPLHAAASFGKNIVIAALIQDNRTDINAQSEVGFTPLHLSSIGEYDDAVAALLANDAVDINAKTVSGLTVLHFASLSGNLAIARLLIGDSRININEKSIDDWTPLHLALNFKKEDIVFELLSSDTININAKGKDDLTPLHLAASSGQKSIVSRLLSKGASIENTDKYGCTPLHLAIESSSLDVVKYLGENGANLYAERNDGYTPLGLAAFNGELDIIKYLVNDKKVNVNTENKNGVTSIEFAANNGYFNIVEFLMDKGANGGFAIHWAAYGGHLNIVKYLIDEKHFDVNKRDKYGNLPAHRAALRGHLDVVKYFIDDKLVSLNAKNEAGYTHLLFAVLGGHLNMIKYFADEKTVDLNDRNETDNSGSTALHLATFNSNLNVIKYLIRKGANVNAFDNYRNTPLFLASSRGHIDMIKYIIQKGGDSKVTNKYDNTPIHFAAWNKHLNIVKYFVENGVNFRVANENGDTPLHVASSIDVSKYLVEKGADPISYNKDGNTPLHLAVLTNDPVIIEYLINKGTDLEASNNRGNTCLHNAASYGKLDAVKYLIKKGANLNARNNDADTPLHLIALNGYLNIVKYIALKFIKRGNNINALNNDHQSPQDVAAEKCHIRIVMFLELARQRNRELLYAADQGYVDKIKEYISKDASLDDNKKRVKRDWIDDWQRNMEAERKRYQEEQYRYNQEKTEKYLREIQEKMERDREEQIWEFHRRLDQRRYEKEQLEALFDSVAHGNLDKVKECIDDGGNVNAVRGERKSTVLHHAAEHDRLEVIKYLIDKGADIKVKDIDGVTPLELANNHGKSQIVNYFVNNKDKSGNTLLHYASLEGNLNLVTLIIDKGANVDIKNDVGSTPLHLAAENGKLEMVKVLIDNDADINAKDINGLVPLELASKQSKSEIVSFLLNQKDKHGNSLLHYAAMENNLKLINLLIEKRADINAKNYLKYDEEPIHFAAKEGYLEAVMSLIDNGADLKAKNNDGSTPLILAIWNGKFDVMRYLIDEKKADINADNTDDNTLLHLAAYRGNIDIVKYLIDEKKIELNLKNDYGWTPLHLTAIKNKLDVAKYLAEKEADLNSKDNGGNTPLLLASLNDNWDVVKFLVEKGGDIRIANHDEWTVLHVVVFSNNLEMLKSLLGDGETLSPKIEATKNVNLNVVVDKFGQTLLHIAAGNGYINIVKYLIRKGADPNVKNKFNKRPLDFTPDPQVREFLLNYNHSSDLKQIVEEKDNDEVLYKGDETPLHRAAWRGHLYIVQYLAENGADINIVNQDGKSPLHYAAYSNHSNIVKYLIEKGVNVNLKDKNNKTALDVALERGNIEIANFIQNPQHRTRPKRYKHYKEHLQIENRTISLESEGLQYRLNTENFDFQIKNNQVKSEGNKHTSWINILVHTLVDAVKDVSHFVTSPLRMAIGTEHFQPTESTVISNTDINGTLFLLDVFIRRITGQKYISTSDQLVSTLEANNYALHISEEIRKEVEQATLKSRISMHRLNIDFVKMQKEIAGKIMGDKFNEVSEILGSYVEKACPSADTGCPGKLSRKKFDKFVTTLNNGINKALTVSMRQMLHSGNKTLKFSSITKEHLSPESVIYLNNTVVQGQLTQAKNLKLKQNAII